MQHLSAPLRKELSFLTLRWVNLELLQCPFVKIECDMFEWAPSSCQEVRVGLKEFSMVGKTRFK